MCPELFPQGFYWYGNSNANLEQSLNNADSQPSEITFTKAKIASTETTAVANDNQLVNHNQLNNQSADISDDLVDKQRNGSRKICNLLITGIT